MPEPTEFTRVVEAGMLRSRDVAVFLGVSRQRVDQLVAADGFPAPRLVARRRMWARVEIETWREQH